MNDVIIDIKDGFEDDMNVTDEYMINGKNNKNDHHQNDQGKVLELYRQKVMKEKIKFGNKKNFKSKKSNLIYKRENKFHSPISNFLDTNSEKNKSSDKIILKSKFSIIKRNKSSIVKPDKTKMIYQQITQQSNQSEIIKINSEQVPNHSDLLDDKKENGIINVDLVESEKKSQINKNEEMRRNKEIIEILKKKPKKTKKQKIFKTADFYKKSSSVNRHELFKRKNTKKNLNNTYNKLIKSKALNPNKNKFINSHTKNNKSSNVHIPKSDQKILEPLIPTTSIKNLNKQTDDQNENILNHSSSHSNINSISLSPLRVSPSQAWLQTIEDGIMNLSKSISAETFIVHDSQYDKVLLAKGEWIKREIASLTKIMTCYSTIKFCEKYNIPIQTTKFEVSIKAARTGGTSARLIPLMYISIEDLLYGLMLPSGNDAGVCLAENIGRIIRLTHGENKNPNIIDKNLTFQSDYEYFIELMNTNCYKLGLRDTKFKNPHGLNCPENYSTCQDILKLCLEANRIKLFQKIVKQKTYTGRFLTRRAVPTPQPTSINKIETDEQYKMTEPNFYNHSSKK